MRGVFNLCVVLVCLASSSLITCSVQAAPQVWPDRNPDTKIELSSAEGLFGPTLAMAALTYVGNHPAVVRSRLTYVHSRQLSELAGWPTTLNPHLVLNLFDDALLTASLQQVVSNPSGSYTWIGQLDGDSFSQVLLVVKDDVVIGKIRSLTEMYEIRYAGLGLHRIVQLDPLAWPDEGNDALPVVAVADSSHQVSDIRRYDVQDENAHNSNADNGQLIDVLIVYTPDTRQAAGGSTAMQNIVELAIAETNLAYASSGVKQRVFLVHTQEVAYIETGDLLTDLPRLKDYGDGYLDEVTQPGSGLRDSFHADEVVLIVETGSCGLGYLHDPAPNPDFAASAFAVVQRDCVTANYSIPHEMGHNMGLRHDWYTDATHTPFTYAHGYINRPQRWRTIMAYNSACVDAGGFNCTRLPYWSNPSLTYNNAVMGVPAGSSTTCQAGSLSPDPSSCDADSHMALNATALTVARFRVSASIWLGHTTDWNLETNWIPARIPRIIDDVTIPTSPEGGQFPIVNQTVSVRNLALSGGANLTLDGGEIQVYGDWEQAADSAFDAKNGRVIFRGGINQSIVSNDASSFYHVQVGDGLGTYAAALRSNLRIKGDLSLQAGASLQSGAYTIWLAGQWNDQAAGFDPDSGQVIFDGGNQSVDRLVAHRVFSQDFSYRDGSDGLFSVTPPTGWTVIDEGDGSSSPSATWLFGDASNAPNANPYSHAYARRWYDGSASKVDAWLFSPALQLNADAAYRLEFAYGVSDATDPQNFSVHLGNRPLSNAMTRVVFSVPEADNTAWLSATQTFGVSTNGNYYLGFRNDDMSPGGGRGGLDTIQLTAFEDTVFNTMTVQNGSHVALQGNLRVKGNLMVYSGGTLDMGLHSLNVDGQGLAISPLQDVSSLTDVYFLGSNGVAINSGLALPLGNTQVFIRDHPVGGCTSDHSQPTLARCYTLTAAQFSGRQASVRFYFNDSHLNGLTCANLKAYFYSGDGASWSAAGNAGGTAVCRPGSTSYVEATGVTTFSDFVLATGMPRGYPAGNAQPPALEVHISGPAQGQAGRPYSFTAVVSPTTATLPISYTWRSSDQPSYTVVVPGITHTAVYTWSEGGTKNVSVTASNAQGLALYTHTIAIQTVTPTIPLQGVVIAGVQLGFVNTTYIFTATLSPVTATLPIVYAWQPAPAGGQGAAVASYTWASSATHTIFVTATNLAGSAAVTAAHIIAIQTPPVTSVYIYLPLVLKAYR